jgi:hypothetical protein
VSARNRLTEKAARRDERTRRAHAVDTLARWHKVDHDTAGTMLDRATRPDFDQWRNHVRRNGGCASPIRVKGTIERNGRTVLDTASFPDGVLLVRCKNRRAAVCSSCAFEHAGDAWQLLRAGIEGGHKGMPDLAEHPSVFVTLTAPSFGHVHSAHDDGPCQAGRSSTCPHGRPRTCHARHDAEDPAVGQPLCADCYDYTAAALFNWYAPALWNRFTKNVKRELARRLGLKQSVAAARYRPAFGKVAEFQTRGAIHLHAVVRLDAATEDIASPGPGVTVEDLEAVVKAAARHAWVRPDEPCVHNRTLRFGKQCDVQPIRAGADMTGHRASTYLSKYLTKGTETFGLPPRRIYSAACRELGLTDHVCRMVEEIEHLEAAGVKGIGRATHLLGFRGHAMSKSRAFSTTFGALRDERTAWRRRNDDDDQGDDDSTPIVNLEPDGYGYGSPGDAYWAALIAAELVEERAHAREAAREHDELRT